MNSIDFEDKEEVVAAINRLQSTLEELKEGFDKRIEVYKKLQDLAKNRDKMMPSIPNKYSKDLVKMANRDIEFIYHGMIETSKEINTLSEMVVTLFTWNLAISHNLQNMQDNPELLEEIQKVKEKISNMELKEHHKKVLDKINKQLKEQEKEEKELKEKGIYR